MPSAIEMPRQPGDRGHVEVVGGLVEHEDVVGAGQHARDVDTPALASRELAHLALHVERAHQVVDNVADARVRCPHVLRRVAEDALRHRGRRVEGVVLPQHLDGQLVALEHAAVVGFERLRQHSQERRLAVAVAPHDADARALVHAQGHPVEHLLGSVLELYVLASQRKRHRKPRVLYLCIYISVCRVDAGDLVGSFSKHFKR